jgi:hypothetical protein
MSSPRCSIEADNAAIIPIPGDNAGSNDEISGNGIG